MSDYRSSDVRRPFASVAAGTTDAELWPAESGYRLRVVAAHAVATAATALTFNTKGSSAGVAISPAYTSANGTPTVHLPYNPLGWFETEPGEGLTATTGAGQTTALCVTLVLQPSVPGLYDERGQPLLAEDSNPISMESA